MTSLLIRDVRIFTGEEEIPNGSVLVVNGKIHQVSDTQLQPLDSSTTTVSKPGHTLLPGFVDAHVHIHADIPWALEQAIRFGVTTVCDMHNDIENVIQCRKQAAESKDAADFKTCSLAATIDNGWPAQVVLAHNKSKEALAMITGWPKLQTPQDVQTYITARLSDGVDYIKLMHESGSGLGMSLQLPPFSLQKSIIDAAHSHNLVAVAHALALDDTIEILNAGIDGLTHTFCDKPPTPELIAAYKRNNAYCNPTLAAIGSLTTQGQEVQQNYALNARSAGLLAEPQVENMCKCMAMAKGHSNVENAYESVRQLKAAGIDIVCGSDSAGPAVGTAFGLSVHHEMALLVRHCGFTPMEALRAATVTPCKRLRFPDRGSIGNGLKADLVLVEGNPLEDIDASLNLKGVWRDGVLVSAYRDVEGKE